MLFRHLEYFISVADERHFSRAAKVCGVSQPTLSSAINKLERELDVKLIDRGHSFAALTEEGEWMLAWARRIVREHSTVKAELSAMQNGSVGPLRLGTMPSASTTSSLLLSAFCAKNPSSTVNLVSTLGTSELYRRLNNFEIDIAILPLVEEHVHEVVYTQIYEERYALIAPASMSLSVDPEATTISWHEAGGLPLSLLTAEMHARQVIDEALAEVGIRAKPQVETDAVGALIAQAVAGDRATIVPHTWLWATLPGSDLRAFELVDPIVKTPIAVAINPSHAASPLAQAFVDSVQHLGLDDFFDRRLGNILHH